MKFHKFAKELDKKTPCYRYINVTITAEGKKIPDSDHSNYTPSQIEKDRGNPKSDWISLSIKHTEYFCLDYDLYKGKHINACEEGILSECPLYEHISALDPYTTKTNKGVHQYIKIKGLDYKTYSQQVNVVKGVFAIDLLKKNNIWAPKDRIIEGNEIEVD